MATTETTAPETAPSANGRGPKMPRHDAWVAIDGYPGFEAYVWTNAPQRLTLDLNSGVIERYQSAYRQMLTDTRTIVDDTTYDGWFDCDGDPLPKPADPDFFARVPTELVVCARLAMRDAVTDLPNSLARRRER